MLGTNKGKYQCNISETIAMKLKNSDCFKETCIENEHKSRSLEEYSFRFYDYFSFKKYVPLINIILIYSPISFKACHSLEFIALSFRHY